MSATLGSSETDVSSPTTAALRARAEAAEALAYVDKSEETWKQRAEALQGRVDAAEALGFRQTREVGGWVAVNVRAERAEAQVEQLRAALEALARQQDPDLEPHGTKPHGNAPLSVKQLAQRVTQVEAEASGLEESLLSALKQVETLTRTAATLKPLSELERLANTVRDACAQAILDRLDTTLDEQDAECLVVDAYTAVKEVELKEVLASLDANYSTRSKG